MASILADSGVEIWHSEDIPDEAFLYLRVHKANIGEDGKPTPGAFRNRPDKKKDGMSTDWSKYATPLETQARAKDPNTNRVIRMNVGDVRRIPNQVVKHTPINEPLKERNRAHTDVYGPKGTQERLLFSRAYEFVL